MLLQDRFFFQIKLSVHEDIHTTAYGTKHQSMRTSPDKQFCLATVFQL